MAANSTLGTASYVIVGRIECAHGQTPSPLYVTICDDTSGSGKVLHVMPMVVNPEVWQQRWCLVRGSQMDKDCFYICSYPSFDRVMKATTEENPRYPGTEARYLQIVKVSDLIDWPQNQEMWVEEGRPLPNLGWRSSDLNSFLFSLDRSKQNSFYNIHSQSDIFKPICTIIQAGYGKDLPHEQDEMIVHTLNGVPREVFWFENDPVDWLSSLSKQSSRTKSK